jgi:hypothetical protein
MSCLLFFNFLLSLMTITLFIVGTTTPKWLVFIDRNDFNFECEHTIGIIATCQRLYRQGIADQYATISNATSKNMNADAYVCYNRLLKWLNTSIHGPELLGKRRRKSEESNYHDKHIDVVCDLSWFSCFPT